MIEAPHFGFVVAAYAIAAVVILGMILAVVADFRAQTRALRAFEQARGRQRTQDMSVENLRAPPRRSAADTCCRC